MKKFLVFLLLINCLMLFACMEKSKSLEEFYQDEQIYHVDKIIIQDGTTGFTKTVTDKEKINEFLTLSKDIQFTPQDHQEKKEGWRYRITLFDGEKNFQFTLEKINGVYYQSNPDFLPIVDTIFKQLKSPE